MSRHGQQVLQGYLQSLGKVKQLVIGDDAVAGLDAADGFLGQIQTGQLLFDSIRTNDNIEGASYITVNEDEYLTLNGCHIEQ